jgi:hypothetical protein
MLRRRLSHSFVAFWRQRVEMFDLQKSQKWASQAMHPLTRILPIEWLKQSEPDQALPK